MNAVKRVFGIDGLLVVSTCLLVLSGIYVLSTAIVGVDGRINQSYEHKQIMFALIGIGIAIVMARVPIAWWRYLFVGTIISVLLVHFIAPEINGARSWISIGPISIQPSEFGKVAMLIAGASFLADRQREIKSARVVISLLAMIALPAAIILMQPDFGTAQMYGWLAIGLLFFAGAKWTHLAAIGGVLVILLTLVMVVMPVLGMPLLKPYQMDRLTAFLDPEANPTTEGYNSIQAKIAIGSGQAFGRPSDEKTQVQQGFLPEPQTDFIFAALVERWGFVGGGVLLALYLLFLSRILYAVGRATNPYSRLIAGGVATLFAAQIFTNVGVVIGVLPVTGVTLPFISYGGSSLWTSMALVGLVLSVLREADGTSVRYERRTGRPASGYGSLRAARAERESRHKRAKNGLGF